MLYKLHKALNGLKQTPKDWNKRINHFLIQLGLKITQLSMVSM